MQLNKNQRVILSLIRKGIGQNVRVEAEGFNWMQLKAYADSHGLSAVALDGLNANENLAKSMPAHFKLEWIGEVLQNYEARFEAFKNAIASLAGFYSKHGLKMMVLKGYACSLDWPRPNHRPCGDIDIWLFGDYKKADSLLSSEKGVDIDTSHHHHTVFNWKGFTVENHYDFINVHHHKSNKELEKILKELGVDDSYSVELRNESSESGDIVKVYVPSPNLHALFLLRHAVLHFTSTELTLRQILDWGFFVKAHGKDVDWDWLNDIAGRFGMEKFYNILNAICVEDLGFQSELFHGVQIDVRLKDRVLADIFIPQFKEDVPSGLGRRILFKYRRWAANGWKHELCYNDSRWSAFWSGVWNHLLKPASI